MGLRLLTCSAAFGLAAAAGAEAQAVSVTPSGAIELRAQAAPIGRVLREIARVAPVRLLVDPAVESRMVTPAAASGLRVDQALDAVLSGSGLPHLVWGGTKGPWRVVLGDESSAVEVKGDAPSVALDGDPTVAGADDVAAAEALAADRQAVAEAQREAEAQPITVSDDPSVPGGYTQTGESITYNDPTFVPYKLRPEVKARRQAVDPSKIP